MLTTNLLLYVSNKLNYLINPRVKMIGYNIKYYENKLKSKIFMKMFFNIVTNIL